MRSSEFINARAAVNAAARSPEIVVHIIGEEAPKRYSNEEAAPVIMGLFQAGYSLSRSCQAKDTGTVYISFRRPEND